MLAFRGSGVGDPSLAVSTLVDLLGQEPPTFDASQRQFAHAEACSYAMVTTRAAHMRPRRGIRVQLLGVLEVHAGGDVSLGSTGREVDIAFTPWTVAAASSILLGSLRAWCLAETAASLHPKRRRVQQALADIGQRVLAGPSRTADVRPLASLLDDTWDGALVTADADIVLPDEEGATSLNSQLACMQMLERLGANDSLPADEWPAILDMPTFDATTLACLVHRGLAVLSTDEFATRRVALVRSARAWESTLRVKQRGLLPFFRTAFPWARLTVLSKLELVAASMACGWRPGEMPEAIDPGQTLALLFFCSAGAWPNVVLCRCCLRR